MSQANQKSDWPVCLINSPVLMPKNQPGVDLFQPLGLAYLAAAIRKKGYPVSIIDAPAEGWKNIQRFDSQRDFNGLNFDQIRQKIREKNPQVVGISITFTVQKDAAFKIASLVKKVDKNIIVVVGGPHVTVRPQESICHPDVDFAVLGEGEVSFPKLLEKLHQKAPSTQLKKVKGVAFKSGRKVFLTPPQPLIQDLDILPFPARDLLPMQTYFKAAKSLRANRDLNKPWASVFTSRGCPFNCVFCSIHLSMGRQWRARSPQNVIQELKHLVKTYGIKQIDFEDDNLSFNKKRLEKICDLIVKNKLKIEWFTPNGVRADTLDESLLRKMKAAGCKELWFAPESGSQRVVDEIIGKKLNLKYVEKMVLACKKIGISCNCFFVIGFPEETKKEILETIAYAKKLSRLGANNCLFSLATPLYGTRLYEEAKKKDLLENFNDSSLSYEKPVLKNPEYTPEELIALRYQALKEYQQAFVKNSFRKLLYYLTHNPILAYEHLGYLYRIGSIFLRRKLARISQKYLEEI